MVLEDDETDNWKLMENYSLRIIILFYLLVHRNFYCTSCSCTFTHFILSISVSFKMQRKVIQNLRKRCQR